jgi:glutamate/tyrosine decarboxylase-like PLP-dependent enzyme
MDKLLNLTGSSESACSGSTQAIYDLAILAAHARWQKG